MPRSALGWLRPGWRGRRDGGLGQEPEEIVPDEPLRDAAAALRGERGEKPPS